MASVGIDYDFAAGQACVSVRTSDDEFSGGVDKELDVIADQSGLFRAELGFDAGDEYVAHIICDSLLHGTVCGGAGCVGVFNRLDEFVVLGGYDYGVDAEGRLFSSYSTVTWLF